MKTEELNKKLPGKFIDSIPEQILNIIKNDEDFSHLIIKTYLRLKPHINGLPPRTQVEICIGSMNITVEAVATYQLDMAEIKQEIKNEPRSKWNERSKK